MKWNYKNTQSTQRGSLTGFVCGLLVLVALVGFSGRPAEADIIRYSDVNGEHVNFVEITEFSRGRSEMFGQPEANSDSISMPAFGFNATACGGLDFHQGLLELTIEAKPGQLIDSIELSEFGSYFQFGELTDIQVHTSAFVEIHGEVFDADSVFANAGEANGNWNQSFQIRFPATDRLRLVVDSQMLAFAGSDQVAFIDKTGMTVRVSTVSVPEPEVVTGLASFALLGLLFARRRRDRFGQQLRHA